MLRLVEALLVARRLHRVDLDFVLVPAGDLDVAIDVAERNAAVGGEGNGLVEVLGYLGMGGHGQQQRESRPCDGACQTACPAKLSHVPPVARGRGGKSSADG